jgi:hypothetical protein
MEDTLMAEVVEQTPAGAYTDTDLVAAVPQVLQRSDEPLTLSKIRASLPAAFRSISLEALEETLRRQAAANVLYAYPKYRSQQNRYWDRPMPVHLAYLLRAALAEKPLPLAELRRKLPDYAKDKAVPVLEEEVAQGNLFRHPALSKRSGERYGARRPDAKDYLLDELKAVFGRLEQLGFTPAELRAGALELLHEEEWASGGQVQAPSASEGSERQAAMDQQSARVEQPEATLAPTAQGDASLGEGNPS